MLTRPGAAGPAPAGRSGPAAVEEVDLIARIARRDLRAFETLYRLYQPRLTRFLHAMLRRPQLIEEAVDDTLMVVWRRAEAYNGASRVSTWIFAIAYRTGLKALRRQDDPVEDKGQADRMSEEPGPEDLMGRRQTQAILLEAMDQLSADHRAVIDLTYFHETGYREIAQIMDCPVDTVKTRVFHARRRLRAALAGRLPEWR
jgi:RNA polymerase sigma factor (sigma-70 family)